MDIKEKNIILTQLKIILDNAKSLQDTAFPNYNKHGMVGFLLTIRQINSLIGKHNKLIPRLNPLFKESEIDEELKEIKEVKEDPDSVRDKNIFPDTESPIVSLIFNCSTAVSLLSIESSISEENIDRLNSVTNELNSVKKEIEANLFQNLMEAKNEFEKGGFLGASLICGKIIRTVIDQIPGEDINKKIEILKDSKLIRDKDGRDSVLKANHYGRNLLSHDLSIFPTSSETISYLGESIKIAKIFSKYKENSMVSEKIDPSEES